MSTLLFANQLQTTLASAIDNTATTIVVAAGTGDYFPEIGENESIKLTIINATNQLINEIVLCTAINGDALTVVRAQEGTIARSWPIGSFIDNLMTSGTSGSFVQQYGLENELYSASFINMTTQTGSVISSPVNPTDLVNKQYVDNISNSQFKRECQVSTIANITLSGLQSLDGYMTIAGDRVLVKNQSNPVYNGIYVASAGSWSRSEDMETWDQVPSAYVFIENGTLYANTSWVTIEPENGTIDVDPINWIQVSGNGTYSAGTGLTLTGTQFSITNTGVTAASYGSPSDTILYTLNEQGQLTASAETPISIEASQINTAIPNSGLENSTISGISLGNDLFDLNLGAGLTGSSYNGSEEITAAIDTSVVATLSGTQILTNKTISGSSNTLTNISNSSLTNSAITINGTSVSLGGSTTVTAISPNSVTFNDSGTGGTSGSEFDGSSALTVSYNTVGASPLAGSSNLITAGIITTGTWNASPIENEFLADSTISGVPLGDNLFELTAGTGFDAESYDGSSAVTFNLSDTGVSAGDYGDSSKTLVASVNSTGQLTEISSVSISISNAQVSGLGTLSTQNANNISVSGGSITGLSGINSSPIGATTRSSGAFTDLSSNGSVTLSNYTGYIKANGASEISASTTIPTTDLSGTISNAQLANSSVTINGTSVSLGGSTTIKSSTTNPLTIGGGLNGSSFDGSSAVTISIANVGTAGTYGTSSQIPVITTNSYGQISSVSNTNIDGISLTTGQISTLPASDNDIANKLYVDTVAQGLSAKDSVFVGTTANITLSGEQTIDGKLTSNSRVLVKNQTNSAENGIYISSSSAWERSPDANTWDELVGAFVFIESGSQASTGWTCTAQSGGTLGTTDINWTQFSSAGSYTAGTGLTLAGTKFSITSTGVSPGPYGSSNSVPIITLNAQGQATVVSNELISISYAQINNSIPNASLANSTISGVSLGGNLSSLTLGSGLTGSSYDGSSAITAAIDTSVVATLSGTQTLTNKTISYASNTLTGVANSGANSNITSLSGLTTPLSEGQGGTGFTAFGTGVATFLQTPTSSNLAAAVTGETGSGALVFGTSPTLSNATLSGTTTTGLTASQVVVTNASSQLASVAYTASPTANAIALRNSTGSIGFVDVYCQLGGRLMLQGATSGSISVTTQAAAGTYNFNLPTGPGAPNQFMMSQGGGSNAMTWANAILSIKTTTYTSTGTYTPSAGILYCYIEVVGGGGGGVSANSSQLSSGSGGGAYTKGFFTAAQVAGSHVVSVGSGGTTGNIGGTTAVGSLINAPGGSIGAVQSTSSGTTNGGSGGAAGSAPGGTLILAIEGGDGGPANAATNNRGNGWGGQSFYGMSAYAPPSGQTRGGKSYGGGAPGCYNATGSSGGNGIVIITEFLRQ